MEKEKITITPEKIDSAKKQESLQQTSEQAKLWLTGIFSVYRKEVFTDPSVKDIEKDLTKELIKSNFEETIESALQNLSEENRQKFLQTLLNELEKPSLPVGALRTMPEDLKIALQDIVKKHLKTDSIKKNKITGEGNKKREKITITPEDIERLYQWDYNPETKRLICGGKEYLVEQLDFHALRRAAIACRKGGTSIPSEVADQITQRLSAELAKRKKSREK